MNAMKLFVLSAFVAAGAFAGDNVKTITWTGLRAACTNPGQFGNQNAPLNITVSCADVQYKWNPGESGSVNLPTSRQISTGVTSNKYNVNAVTESLKTAEQPVACYSYNEVAEMVQLTKAVTCAEILALPEAMTGTQYCQSLVDEYRASNPGAIRTNPTGKVASFCAATGGAGQRPNKN